MIVTPVMMCPFEFTTLKFAYAVSFMPVISFAPFGAPAASAESPFTVRYRWRLMGAACPSEYVMAALTSSEVDYHC